MSPRDAPPRGPGPRLRRAAGPCNRPWHLRQLDLFADVPAEEVDRLAAILGTGRYRAGEPIMGPESPAEAVYIVLEGTVRLFHRAPDGRELTIALLERGRLFGLPALLGTEVDAGGLRAEAATDATICRANEEDFQQLLDRQPDLMIRLAQLLAARLLDVEQRVGRLVGGDARARLGAALADLARRSGVSLPEPAGALRIGRSPTHLELAREIGASRETVTRALAALEADGLVRREGRSLVVLDPARLANSTDV
jgi:CRP/FNR family cyclic AMP-dependent transcriptional regulator